MFVRVSCCSTSACRQQSRDRDHSSNAATAELGNRETEEAVVDVVLFIYIYIHIIITQ